MGIPEKLQLIHVIILGIGVLVIGSMQVVILRRTTERDSFVSLIDGILELKKWAMGVEHLMDAVGLNNLVRALKDKGIVKSEKELMEKCTFFFHMEKLYHLSQKSGISPDRRAGLNNEIEMWLSAQGMDEFFREFCEVAGCYTQDFMNEVRKKYDGGHFGS